MNTIRCLIIDDEPMARGILENYVERIHFLEHVGSCSDALQAIATLHETEVDAVFVDIKMPEVTGLEFIRSLEKPPKFIFTTAFSEYAVESYELDAVDYLLKPISFERFLKAVNRLANELKPASSSTSTELSDYLFIREDGSDYKVFFDDILFAQSYGNYVKVFTAQKMYLTPSTLKDMEKRLPPDVFLRVHRTSIVHRLKVTAIQGDWLSIGTHRIDIGSHYKKTVLEKLKG